MKITKKIAEKVVETVSAGLCKGVGQPKAGEMCVEAAVCYAMGLPHGDNPPCVSPAIRAVKIALNDANWSSNDERAKGMIRLAVLQLGTKDNFDDKEFVKRLAKLTISTVVPRALRHAASIHPDLKHKEELEQAAITCEKEMDEKAARAADAAARAAARAAYAAYVADAAYAARAAYAAYVADAAYAASAAYAAYVADAAYAASDKELLEFAKGVEDILIDMKVQGVKWLKLIKE